MRLLITGASMSPRDIHAFLDDKEIENLVELRLELQANELPRCTIEFTPTSVWVDQEVLVELVARMEDRTRRDPEANRSQIWP